MTRLLLDRATNQLLPYPRQDSEPVVGLDRAQFFVLEVVEHEQPTDYDTSIHAVHSRPPIIEITNLDSDRDVNGTVTYGWELREVSALAPPPNWSAFQAELLQSAAFAAARIKARQILESELLTAEGERLQRLLRASTALSAIDAAVLGAASDQAPFIAAWLNLRRAGLVSPEVASGMAQIATTYHLSAELIRALGAPDQPA
jgi:hypothetical protein